MLEPTAKQIAIRDHQALSLLVLAPAGCGKTEALSLRVRGLISRGTLPTHSRILVTTFSNRARDNVKERMRAYLSPQEMRDSVTVCNFHGLAARIFRAHANVLNLDPRLTIPTSDWVAEQCRTRGLTFATSTLVQRQLQDLKLQGLADDQIDAQLVASGTEEALAIERQRISEGRLTYDDLPRYLELLLANEWVRQLYQYHFAAVVVDEFQDLTPQQLRIVNQIGFERTTYAGDLAQGIYSFAGADPIRTLSALRAECSDSIELDESHRSSPAVLAQVNSLIGLTGGLPLRSANPTSWPGGGLAGGAGFKDVISEADWVWRFCSRVLAEAPSHRIGILSRSKPRRRFVDARFQGSGVPFYRWEDGILDSGTARAIKSMLTRLSMAEYISAPNRFVFLQMASEADLIQDPDDRSAMNSALVWTYDLLEEGASPAQISQRIRITGEATLLSLAGVHMLTGHTGKGQQFDWIVVVGLEEDILPDFRQVYSEEAIAEEARILAVMLSRARHGVVMTASLSVPTNTGADRDRRLSRFLSSLSTARPLGMDAIDDWLNSADWKAIRAR